MDAEIYTYTFPPRVSAEFIEMEEKERQDRISRGVDPILYAKIFRCQTELMHRHFPTSWLNDARARGLSLKGTSLNVASSISEKLSALPSQISAMAHNLFDSVKGKEAELEARAKPIIDHMDARSLEFSLAANQKVEDWKWASHGIAQDANKKVDGLKESLRESAEFVGEKTSVVVEDVMTKLNLSVDPSSRAAEEKERVRRMNEKLDPMTAARLGRVQAELVQTVHSI